MLGETQTQPEHSSTLDETQKRPRVSSQTPGSSGAEHRDIGLKRATTNSIAFFFAQIMNKISTFIAFILVSNFLAPEIFGLYTIVLTIREIFNSLATFGLDQVLVRSLAQSNSTEERKRHLLDAVLMKAAFSIIAVIVAITVVRLLHFSSDIVLGTFIVMGDLILLNISTSLTSFYRASLDSTPATIMQGISRLIYLVLLIIGLWLHVSWLLLLLPLVIADTILCLILTINLRTSINQVVAIPTSSWRSMLRQSIPLGLSAIAVLLYTRLDTLMIAQLRNNVEVALYSAAYKLTETPLVLATSIEASMLPIISAIWVSAANKDVFYATTSKAMRLTYACALPIGVGLTFFGQQIIDILYHGHHTEYVKIVPSVAVMGWAMVAMSSNLIVASILTAMKRQRLFMPIAVINLLINVGVNLWAIPKFGYFGSAVATTVTEGFNAFALILVITFLSRDLRVAMHSLLAALLGAISLLVFFIVYNAHPPLLVGILAMMSLFVVFLVFRIIKISDIQRAYGSVARFLPSRKGLPPMASNQA